MPIHGCRRMQSRCSVFMRAATDSTLRRSGKRHRYPRSCLNQGRLGDSAFCFIRQVSTLCRRNCGCVPMTLGLHLKLPVCRDGLQMMRLRCQDFEESGVKPTSVSGRWCEMRKS